MNKVFIPSPDAKILVVGDVILDRYVHGDTTRISPEAPVPVVLVRQIEEKPGGAGNVALNISQLGLGVCLVGITGIDPSADFLREYLEDHGVSCSFLNLENYPTITKLRVLSQHQQLVRLDYEVQAEHRQSGELYNLYTKVLDGADVVVLSDYAKGSLLQIQEYISGCRRAGKNVLVDPKGGDFSRYRGASILTPNMKEFEQVAGSCTDISMLVEKGRNLCKELELDSLLVTRGEHGMTLITRNEEPLHLDAEAREVFDVTGAGDTVIATLAAAIASGYSTRESAVFANHAAGLVVARLGAASVTAEELNRSVHGVHSGKIIESDKDDIGALVSGLREYGKKIVMTNGCFDILHAGHVRYLAKARELGDYLIVAVNDDDSVRRLKGNGRPIHTLENRLTVLESIDSIDWLIPFSTDTPEDLVKLVSPDVLVKGGDYVPEQVAGAASVLENGGQVIIIPLIPGCSTTRIINALNKEAE